MRGNGMGGGIVEDVEDRRIWSREEPGAKG